MNCAIFTYGSFLQEYGGQCKLLKQGFKKNNIKVLELEGKQKKLFTALIFYLLGLRSGLMFTGFAYKLNIPKILISSNFIISFAQVIPWNLFFFLIINKIKIIYWNDMPIEKIVDIYVKGLFWKKIIIFISKVQFFFLAPIIVGTNRHQFKTFRNISIVPRIVDECFYTKNNKKDKSKVWTLVLIGNDFLRKKFEDIISIINKFSKKNNLDFKIYIIGECSALLKKKFEKKVLFLNKLSKKKISQFFRKLQNFFTISISKNEGAPISLLEVQSGGGFSICTKHNGGKSYVPRLCVFNNNSHLLKILKKLITNKKFRYKIKKFIIGKSKKYNSVYIAKKFITLANN